MDRQEGLAADLPPQDPAPDASPEILSTPADDDPQPEHEAEQEQDQDHEHEDAPGEGVLTDDLKNKIIRQMEYYFSDENLLTDKYMLSLIKKNKQGFVPISIISSFKRMKKLTRDLSVVVAALKESSLLAVSPDFEKVKRINPLIFTEARDLKFYTVVVENLPTDHSTENIRRIFGEVGSIKNISIHDPQVEEESKKGSKTEILISNKLHAIVEYETVDAAEKAVATLNDKQDWRNGMRVKLLKQMGKYGQRRQAWRDHDVHGNGRASNQTEYEDHNGLSEHPCDMADEEDGEHLPKEKNGHRVRGRGKARRQKHRSTNGLGHGAASSAHVVEVSKPPPGPKMPDGTRGFTIGRGRPLAST